MGIHIERAKKEENAEKLRIQLTNENKFNLVAHNGAPLFSINQIENEMPKYERLMNNNIYICWNTTNGVRAAERETNDLVIFEFMFSFHWRAMNFAFSISLIPSRSVYIS